MARRGRFGILPRVAPDLTSTIVGIAHDMQNQRDSLIMDAWKNGGTFEGKKATDSMVLAYWQKRQGGLSKDDPLYETYKDNIMQLQYGIAQSKQDLLHVQKKITDGQYAQFFLTWAKKVPQGSEFWRTLQKDAAQLLEAARASGAASAARRKVEAFNAFVKSTTAKDIAIADQMTAAVMQLSSETGLSITGNGEQLLALLTQDYKNHPDKYHALGDVLKANDPQFSGIFTSAYFSHHIDTATTGYSMIADRAHHDGYASAYNQATKNQTEMAKLGENTSVWPVAKSYDKAYATFAKVWQDPNASSIDKQKAAAQMSATAASLANSAGIDTATKNMLMADATRLSGGDAGDSPSFGQAMLGHTGVTPDVAAQITYLNQQQSLMAANPGAYAYASVGKDGTFDPSGSGPIGIVATNTIPAGAQYVAVPGMSGVASMVAVLPHSVLVGDPNDTSASPTEIGKAISYQVGGRTVTMYGYTDKAGGAHWSLTPPWADGVTSRADKDGNIVLTLPSAATQDPATRAAAIDKKYGTDITKQLSTPGATSPTSTQYIRSGDGTITGKVEVHYAAGKDGAAGSFTVTQTGYTHDANGNLIETDKTPLSLNVSGQDLVSAALSPSRQVAGEINGVTFSSPIQASVAASTAGLSADQVGALSQDPIFQHAFLVQTMQNLGTSDVTDPRIASAWDQATTQLIRDQNNNELRQRRALNANERLDLAYPKPQTTAGATSQGALSINFGGTSLKLPNVPNYLNGQSISAPAQNPNTFGPIPSASEAQDAYLQTLQHRIGVFGPTAPAATVAPVAPVVTPTTTPVAPVVAPTVIPTVPPPMVSPGSNTVHAPGGRLNF